MCASLKVEWTVTPLFAPQPWIICSTCAGPKPFRAGDRLRLNANGKKLDAWVIYKCLGCDKTWNRPLFARRPVRTIDAATLDALQCNDRAWIARHAFDLEALRRLVPRVEEFPECKLHKRVISAPDAWTVVEIIFRLPLPLSIRFDRLLANELGLSRARLLMLAEKGHVTLHPNRKDGLRRPPRDGVIVVIHAMEEADRQLLKRSACGVDTH